MSELSKITKRQWLATGIAVAVDIVIILIGLYFTPIITEWVAPNTTIPFLFNIGIVLLLFISTIVIIRLVNRPPEQKLSEKKT